MTVTHLNHNARYHHQYQHDPSRGLRKVQGFSNLECGVCTSTGATPAAILHKVVAAANLRNGMSRYQRSSSPGARKLVVPGRSSTGTFPSSYEPHSTYSRSLREDYSTPRSGGVIPISTEVYTNYPPPAPGSAYSGRPRARAGSDAIAPSLRTRNVIHDTGIARPSSPLTRNYETVHIKPSTKHEHKKTYTIKDGTAKLIAETEIAPREHRNERVPFPMSGSGATASRSRDIDDASFSYTDPAGMFRDTEPRWRARRGSIDRGKQRPVSMIDNYLPPPPPPPRIPRESGPPPSTRGFDKIVPLSRGGGSLRDPIRSSVRDVPVRPSSRDGHRPAFSSRDVPVRSASRDGHRPPVSSRDVPVRSASRDGHRPPTYDIYREGGPYERAAHRSTTVLPTVINPPRDNREDRYYQAEFEDREREARRSRRFEDEAVASRGFGIRSGSIDRHRSNSSSAEALPRPPPPPSNPAAAIYGAEPLVKIPSVSDYAPKPVLDDRRIRAESRLAAGPVPSVMDDQRNRAEVRRNSVINDYPPPPREERPMSRVMSREDRGPPPRDDRGAYREERRELRSEPRTDYLPAPGRDERRNSEDRRDRGDKKEREHERPREREREYERPNERPREREWDEPRRDDKSRREEKGREDKIRQEKTREDKTRDLAAKGVAAAGVAAAGAMAGAAYQDKRNREKKEESDEERRRSDEERRRSDDEVRKSRREPNDKEDLRERKYADRDRDDRKKEKKEVIDPDEDYRRRVQQAEIELTRQRSNEDDRSGSDRERRRRDRREREERERQEKERRDRPLEIKEAPPPPALRREDILPPPKEAVPVSARRDPVPAGRGRDYAESTHSDDQHNRYESRQSNFLDGPLLTTEPEPMARESSAKSSVSSASGPLVSTRNGDTPSETPDEKELRERRVTIVEPRKDEPAPEVPVKGILRRPTKVFPEYPNPIREGVTPLKERLEKKGASAKEIPKDAKWTKIDRKLVNPQSLEEKGVRFEERLDCVIVLSVLTRDEISEFAKRTEEIREEREERYRKEKSRSRRHHEDDEIQGPSSDSEEEYRRRHERESRHEKEKERGGDRDRERERDRDSHRRRDYVDDYSTEEDSARRAIDDGKRKKRGDRLEDDPYMSGGLGR
ncbi:hypothetical protein FKW77_005380 [Venturia effusa]|uniref:DUF8035 domain-containing protein n=1 Tax=Venturia effusa TaxID=50376 RepID=A0A517L1C2_9PEZI|nr:hypothetical protein FKW77_005380 [Venturia effusa]